MMFLDYKPAGTNENTCYFAPKLPTAWTTMSFNNLYSQGQRFNITVAETNSTTRADVNKLTSGSMKSAISRRLPAGSPPVIVVTNSTTRADVNKLTSGSLKYDIYLRIPAGGPPVIVVTNGVYHVPAGGD